MLRFITENIEMPALDKPRVEQWLHRVAAEAVSSSNEKEDVTIIAKVTDNVCKQNVPEAKVVVNVHNYYFLIK